MEENKNLVNSEPEAENTSTDADTFAEENDTEQTIVENKIDFSVFDDEPETTEEQTGETDVEPIENDEEAEPEKKKRFIQTPIIISVVIVALVALGFLVFKCFFDTSIVGTWTIETDEAASTADEADDGTGKTYYIFDNDGTATVAFGTIKHVGTYSVTSNEDGTQTVNMEIPTASLSASFDYSVTGNIFSGRTMIFTDSYENEYKFVSDNLKIPELKPADDFTPNDKLTDEWHYYDEFYGIDITYIFNENGTVSFNQNDMAYINGIYAYTDDTITITYFTSEEVTAEMSYELYGDRIMIDGLPYYRAGSASADEAKQSTLSE